jgi:hypothetical protein
MSPPIGAIRTSSLQASAALSPAAGTQRPANAGLSMIRGQSHSEPARGLSEGLSWRNARTLGLGTVVKGVLSLSGWVLKGIGSAFVKGGSWLNSWGQGMHRQPEAGRFKQGLGYATRGLGYLLQGLGIASKFTGSVSNLVAKPVGGLVTGLEKVTYLAAAGLAKGAMALARRAASHGDSATTPALPSELNPVIDRMAAEGLQLDATQLADLARYAANPSSQTWPAGLDPALQKLIVSS